jgi:hypothetical protein
VWHLSALVSGYPKSKYAHFKKNARIFLVSILFLSISGSIAFYFQYQKLGHLADPQIAYIVRKAPKSVVVFGYQFTGIKDGRELFSIEAVKHCIKKKKIGFMSVSTGYEAIYKNAIIDIHLALPKKNYKDENYSIRDSDYRFDAIFAEDVMPMVSRRDIVSLNFEPVAIHFYDSRLVTRIEAEKASICPREKKIKLSGEISVESGARYLTTDSLTINSKTGVLEAIDGFSLRGREKLVKGDHGKLALNLQLLEN